MNLSFYIAEPPEKLGLYVERQIHLLEENKKSLDIIVPQLKGIQREQGEKPTVQFFDGKEGVLSSNHDVFSDKEANQMRERRISLGIKSKAIYNSKTGEKPSDETGERLKIDENKYPIKSDITIYGDKVRIAVFGKRISGIFVKNQEFADTLKSLIKYIFDHK